MGKVLYVWPNGCTQSCVKWNVLYYRHSTWACLDLISSSAVIPALASKWSSTPLPPVWVGSRQTWPVLISQYISYLTSHFYFILFHLLFFYTNHLFSVFTNSLSIDDKWHNISMYTMFQIRAGWNRKKRSCSNGKTRLTYPYKFVNTPEWNTNLRFRKTKPCKDSAKECSKRGISTMNQSEFFTLINM